MKAEAIGVSSWSLDHRFRSAPDDGREYTQGRISWAMRCTVPEPTPNVEAILSMPTRLLSILRALFSMAASMRGRPRVLPLATAR
jgi:hypothetical protein